MRANTIKSNIGVGTAGVKKDKTLNYGQNNKDIINLENLEEEDSGLEKGDSEIHNVGSSDNVI